MRGYLRRNLVGGLAVSPLAAPAWLLAVVALFGALAMGLGLAGGLFTPGLLDSPLAFVLPFTLFVFPSLLEEGFFRGILIPRHVRDRGPARVMGFTALSTALFVAWHPLNAATINPAARVLFFDPLYLLITGLLGITCSIGYIYSRSLWVPVLIHWATVVVWVLFLGGHNLVLKM